MLQKQAPRKWFLAVIRNPAWVCLIWFGMTAGISLLATPIRFSATTITRSIALDVGQVVFAALNQAEFVALIILLVLVRLSSKARELWAGCGALALILIAQSMWLLPSKLLLLLYLGFRSMQMLLSEAKPSIPGE